ncbi:WD40 repeat domain-containing protein [Spirosoma sp. BT702]|uniref:WD40 repeat domain-containing protein n=1 Tax=Spirosoma profusum TaxID=2771354 RepID=A0A926XXI1_9BACT|nr:cytochrome D1 domain-containing protein [Spirosoma profusum]MBD2702653.1 WD40 repeat domain-containing protein [Spirosoma profusum]
MIVEKIDTFGGHRDCVYSLERGPSPDQFFSAGGDGQVVRWNLNRPDLGDLVASIPASVYALAFQPDAGLLWIGQNYEGLHIVDPIQKREINSVKLTTAAIFDIKLYKDDAFVALADGVLAILDVNQLVVRKHIKASSQSARCITINPVEREFAVGYSDNMVRIFDLETYTLKRTLTAHTNSVFTVSYSPDFRYLLTAGRDAHMKVWDVENNYVLQQDVVAHMFAINHLAFSSDGRLFATASMDKSVKIWDAETYRLVKVVDKARHAGHGTSVNKILWTGQPELLLSASDDRTISVWKLIN